MSSTETASTDIGSSDTDNEDIKGSIPQMKRIKKGHLTMNQKRIILKLYNREIRKNIYDPIDNIVNNISSKTCVSSATVYKIVREYKKFKKLSAPKRPFRRRAIVDAIDDYDKNSIRELVHQFFYRNEMPSVDTLLTTVNDDDDLPSFKRSTFYKCLNTINFKSRRLGGNSILTERDEIILWRTEYLQKIESFRNENRNIYYLGDTWVNAAGHTRSHVYITGTKSRNMISSGLSKEEKNSLGKRRFIFCHIGSNEGFVPEALTTIESKEADYYEEIRELFKNWFSNILSKLEPNAVIVMSVESYYKKKFEKVPNSGFTETSIKDWLTSKNIPFKDDMSKEQLLYLVKINKDNYIELRNQDNIRIFDEIAKNHDKTVLYLPPYHCELNPIRLIWSNVEYYVANKNTTFKFEECKNLFYEAVETITKETWENCIKYVQEKVEKKMCVLDSAVENKLEPMTNLGESSLEYSE